MNDNSRHHAAAGRLPHAAVVDKIMNMRVNNYVHNYAYDNE
jgi:hypothetical protein